MVLRYKLIQPFANLKQISFGQFIIIMGKLFKQLVTILFFYYYEILNLLKFKKNNLAIVMVVIW